MTTKTTIKNDEIRLAARETVVRSRTARGALKVRTGVKAGQPDFAIRAQRLV